MVAQTKPRQAGFSLIELLVVLAIIALLLGLILAAVQNVRAAAARLDCQNRLRQVSLGLQQYHDAHRVFPPGLRTSGDPYLYMTWLARILPYVEQQSLWDACAAEYALNPLFYSPHGAHQTTGQRPVALFNCPSGDRSVGTVRYASTGDTPFHYGLTWYLGVSGAKEGSRDGVLFAESKVRLGDIADGTSNTVAIGERPPSSDDNWGWWYAGFGQYGTGSADSVLPALGYPIMGYRFPTCERTYSPFQPGRRGEICDTLHFWSYHSGGANFAFADGHVQFLRYSAAEVLPALATRSGGEVVPGDY